MKNRHEGSTGNFFAGVMAGFVRAHRQISQHPWQVAITLAALLVAVCAKLLL